ncbi:MAG: Uma2 family endonuclease [Saprospiraceae bacterium]
MGAIEKLEDRKYTLEEYLALEEVAEYKSEFWDGTIVAMAGGKPNHNKIANSIGRVIENELDKKNKNCSTFNSDQKVFIPKFNHGVYPDCMVICGEEELHGKSTAMVTNPSLIIEVLSKSTKEYDKGEKFEGYRSLPSFKEYVLIWQTIPKVQSWYKEAEDLWRISSVFGLDKTIELYSIGCTLQLKDIYRRVNNLGDKEINKAY